MTDEQIQALWQKANGSKPDGVLLHMVRDFTAELLSASNPAVVPCELCTGVGKIGTPGQRCFACDGSGKSKFPSPAAQSGEPVRKTYAAMMAEELGYNPSIAPQSASGVDHD